MKVSYQKIRKRGEKTQNTLTSRLYSVELDEIRKLDGQLRRQENLQQNTSASSSEETVAAFESKVKEYFDNVSKVVDENGEPLVVYHYTEERFKAFRSSRSKDGLLCAITVELDGKTPGLLTSDLHTPSQTWQPHSRRPSKDKNITPDSNVKLENIEFDFLRNVKHPDVESGARVRQNATNTPDNASFSMEEINEPVEAPVTFSVIGEKAKTWGKYKDRAFEGRDDGMMRANS